MKFSIKDFFSKYDQMTLMTLLPNVLKDRRVTLLKITAHSLGKNLQKFTCLTLFVVAAFFWKSVQVRLSAQSEQALIQKLLFLNKRPRRKIGHIGSL